MRLSRSFLQLVACALALVALAYVTCVLLITRQTVWLLVFCLVFSLICAVVAHKVLTRWSVARCGLTLMAVALAILALLSALPLLDFSLTP